MHTTKTVFFMLHAVVLSMVLMVPSQARDFWKGTEKDRNPPQWLETREHGFFVVSGSDQYSEEQAGIIAQAAARTRIASMVSAALNHNALQIAGFSLTDVNSSIGSVMAQGCPINVLQTAVRFSKERGHEVNFTAYKLVYCPKIQVVAISRQIEVMCERATAEFDSARSTIEAARRKGNVRKTMEAISQLLTTMGNDPMLRTLSVREVAGPLARGSIETVQIQLVDTVFTGSRYRVTVKAIDDKGIAQVGLPLTAAIDPDSGRLQISSIVTDNSGKATFTVLPASTEMINFSVLPDWKQMLGTFDSGAVQLLGLWEMVDPGNGAVEPLRVSLYSDEINAGVSTTIETTGSWRQLFYPVGIGDVVLFKLPRSRFVIESIKGSVQVKNNTRLPLKAEVFCDAVIIDGVRLSAPAGQGSMGSMLLKARGTANGLIDFSPCIDILNNTMKTIQSGNAGSRVVFVLRIVTNTRDGIPLRWEESKESVITAPAPQS